MVRIEGDENLSDAERVAAIQQATGASAGKAENLLEQARGAPINDIVVIGTTAEITFGFVSAVDVVFRVPSGAELRSFTFGDPSSRAPKREKEGVLHRG